MPLPGTELESLLVPVDTQTFVVEYWETQPLVITRGDPSRYAAVFRTADVAQVIALTRPRVDDPSQLAREPRRESSYVKGMPPDSKARDDGHYPSVADFQHAYARGKTVVIMGMQQRWVPIARVCRGLEAAFFCPVHANLYLTPAGAQGFDAHFDTHEVFVLQLEGTKRWRLYGAPRRLPLVGEQLALPRDELGPAREVELGPGDLLYIPRGFVHEAFTEDSASAHLTVGINTYRWADLLHEALADVAAREPLFRQSVPAQALEAGADERWGDRFRELLSVFAREARLDAALGSLGDQFFESLRPLPSAPFLPPEGDPAVGADTVLEKPPGAICRVVSSGRWVEIVFPGGRVGGPARIAPALRKVAGADRLAVRELPDELGEEGKLVLARRLVREGLLRFAEQPAGGEPSGKSAF